MVADPYVYVGPRGGPPRRDMFWNANFGAARTSQQVNTIGDVVAFYHEGHELTHALNEEVVQ